ncbi:PaaX family transcriptional regulator [Actinopolymorpha pittospori]|uniref:Phenylacetic acid degradation operon negative regulatory protein n=1 Tax=Actinopolymorpha pittospori TaxID=648752 RepID=A0A927N360_9ACTN|nr:PaaX family transcriptional regulator C-terminal domain-containing protein [Actinopolymorpha pittospori]MBE1611796.1 phenylacetic acid degradation operon negative regulatory protein [Actinopolymorpha pittospori]
MQARSALFDLYGDYVRSRGGSAPIAALVRLLAPLGIAAPAVRTAVSRMVRQGWLEPVRLPVGPGYALTPRAVRRLDDAAARIYRTRSVDWDCSWHLLVIPQIHGRSARERFQAGLGFLGYARLNAGTWLAPRRSEEVDALLRAEGARADSFVARDLGDPVELADRAFDLASLGAAYRRWLAEARTLATDSGGTATAPPTGTPAGAPAAAQVDAEEETVRAYATRSVLVHEWRKFLFRDPGLPRALLPADWPGDEAAAYFDTHATRLLPSAARFVDTCLAHDGGLS